MYLALEIDHLLDLLVRKSPLGRDKLFALLGVGVEETGGDLTRGWSEGNREGRSKVIKTKKEEDSERLFKQIETAKKAAGLRKERIYNRDKKYSCEPSS